MATELSPSLDRLPERAHEFVRRLIAEFQPQKVILFGSYAYGIPREGSDIDLMVIIPCEGHPLWTAIEIRGTLLPRFGLDLVVCTPEEVDERLAEDEDFMTGIVTRGVVLHAG